MAQPTIFARIKKPVHDALLKVCEEENRPMTRQIEVILQEWLAARAKQRKVAAQ